MKMNRIGAAEWYWIMIGIIISLVVAIFILSMFFDFGFGIRSSFDSLLGLTTPEAAQAAATP